MCVSTTANLSSMHNISILLINGTVHPLKGLLVIISDLQDMQLHVWNFSSILMHLHYYFIYLS